MLIAAMTMTIVLLQGTALAQSSGVGLEEAVEAAWRNDPWLAANRHRQEAVRAKSVAAGELPDPTLSAGLVNFPTDTFDFDQEAMTQVKVGITQMFPRGDSLGIKRKRLGTMGEGFPFQRLNREAETALAVSQLWLDAYNARESIELIEQNRPLFEQLAAVAEANYSSALGRTRQHDMVRAQLELTKLEDRLTMLRQKQETLLEQLGGRMQGSFAENYLDRVPGSSPLREGALILSGNKPQIRMIERELYTASPKIEAAELYSHFASHPLVQAVEKEIEASKLNVDLVREGYKPQWSLNGSYGYRGAAPGGSDRADFVSVGLSFDLPFFTKNRQDKEMQAAVSESLAAETEKWSLLRDMIAAFAQNKARLKRLTERQKLYEQQLLPQMHEQAEASLTAYTNDDGDFAEAVRARIALLNASIDALDIDLARDKTILRLNYYFMDVPQDIITAR